MRCLWQHDHRPLHRAAGKEVLPSLPQVRGLRRCLDWAQLQRRVPRHGLRDLLGQGRPATPYQPGRGHCEGGRPGGLNHGGACNRTRAFGATVAKSPFFQTRRGTPLTSRCVRKAGQLRRNAPAPGSASRHTFMWGGRAQVGENTYHESCAVCATCHASFGGAAGGPYRFEDNLYCKPCLAELRKGGSFSTQRRPCQGSFAVDPFLHASLGWIAGG
jgi:hypothetical protein